MYTLYNDLPMFWEHPEGSSPNICHSEKYLKQNFERKMLHILLSIISFFP
jgi:hypothetical protein